MADAHDPAGSVAAARTFLRQWQEHWADGLPSTGDAPPRTVAQDRRHAAEILERVQPGPHENPVYLDLLARQAASVERFLLDEEGIGPRIAEVLPRILIGSTGEPASTAGTTSDGDASVIKIPAGMIALRAGLARTVAQIQQTTIDEDSSPIGALTDTLFGWLFNGVATIEASNGLAELAERFVVAHEYGHAILDQFRVPLPWLHCDEVDALTKELRADMVATLAVVGSAAKLDGVPPRAALQGAILAVKAHEMAGRAIDMAAGETGTPGPTSAWHAPVAARLELVQQTYGSMVEDAGDEQLSKDSVLLATDEIWERVRPRLVAELYAGSQLHPLWTRRQV